MQPDYSAMLFGKVAGKVEILALNHVLTRTKGMVIIGLQSKCIRDDSRSEVNGVRKVSMLNSQNSLSVYIRSKNGRRQKLFGQHY